MAKLSAAHAALIEALEPAGWRRTELSLVMNAADLTCQVSAGQLYLHRPSIREATLVRGTWSDGSSNEVVVQDDGDVDPLVRLLVDSQDGLTPTTFAEFETAVGEAYGQP